MLEKVTFSNYIQKNRVMVPFYEDVVNNKRLEFVRPEGVDDPMVIINPGSPWEELLVASLQEGPTVCTALLAEAHVLALGPKVFRPTREQLAMLSRTEPRVPFREYRQPFPAMVIEYPEEGHHGGFWTIVLQTPYSIVCSTINPQGQYLNLILSPKNKEETIGSVLDRASQCLNDDSLPFEEGERGTSLVGARTAINACLLLTLYGARRKGVDNQSHEDRLKRYLDKARKGKGKNDVEKAERELRLLPVVYSFAQEVNLSRQDRMSSSEVLEPTGRHLHPHWRSGHIRTQHYGTALTESRLIYIAPVLVNSHLLLGKPSDTLTVYRTRN